MEYVDVDGMRIAYARSGSGPPLVMLHGAPSVVLPTIGVPTLILHGEADVRSPLANAEALHAATSTTSCSRTSVMRAWWRNPRRVRRRYDGS